MTHKAAAYIVTILLACCVVPSLQAADRRQPNAVAALARNMIDTLQKIEVQISDDEAKISEGWDNILKGAAHHIEAEAFARHRIYRSEIITAAGHDWNDPKSREVVLLQLATVDLAIDDVVAAEHTFLRGQESARSQALRELLQLLRQIRSSQLEFLRYLEDESAAKKLGDLNTSLIASAVVEGKELREELKGRAQRSNAELTRQKEQLEKTLQTLLELLKPSK